MRVVGGRARGHKLKKVPGDTTRPITDRVKENLFNILGGWVDGTRWLDLFAGTGQVGIEALSRGASNAVFVDNARPATRTVKANLSHTKLGDYAEVRLHDAFDYLARSDTGCFDVIYIAPPQYQALWIKALRRVDEASSILLSEAGLAIVQIDPREFEEIRLSNLVLADQRKYGNTMLCFYELAESTTS
jgi:16S rRNA (guanine(966)-N(2))-methyltransferase RsmD